MCWYCGSAVKDSEPLGRSLKCIDCGKDIRSCKHCRHYRPSGCAESVTEKPSDIERSNFCDWFSLNPRFRETTGGERKSKGQAASANAVTNAAASANAKSAFDDLFK